MFGDQVIATALLDRLLHHAVVILIDGASYRLRRHADMPTSSPRRCGHGPSLQSPIPHRAVYGHRKLGAPIQPTADHQPKLGDFIPAQMRRLEAALQALGSRTRPRARRGNRRQQAGMLAHDFLGWQHVDRSECDELAALDLLNDTLERF